MVIKAVFEDEMLDILRNAEMVWFEKNVYRVEFYENSKGDEWVDAYFHAPKRGKTDWISPSTGKPADHFAMRLPKGTIDNVLKEWKARM